MTPRERVRFQLRRVQDELQAVLKAYNKTVYKPPEGESKYLIPFIDAGRTRG